jgi:hypothetical protein
MLHDLPPPVVSWHTAYTSDGLHFTALRDQWQMYTEQEGNLSGCGCDKRGTQKMCRLFYCLFIYLFIYGLFYDAAHSNKSYWWIMNWNGAERKHLYSALKQNYGIFLEQLGNSKENFSQDTRFSGRDSKRSHPEQHSQALLIGPNCSVIFF